MLSFPLVAYIRHVKEFSHTNTTARTIMSTSSSIQLNIIRIHTIASYSISYTHTSRTLNGFEFVVHCHPYVPLFLMLAYDFQVFVYDNDHQSMVFCASTWFLAFNLSKLAYGLSQLIKWWCPRKMSMISMLFWHSLMKLCIHIASCHSVYKKKK